MPRRQSVTQMDSAAVQGDGSWVRLRKLTVGEIRDLRAASKDGDSYEIGESVIRSRILEWNWCDEDGQPLAQVAENPGVFDAITSEELAWLAEAVAGNEATRKN